MMSPTTEVGSDRVPVDTTSGEHHPAVLLALPRIDPTSLAMDSSQRSHSTISIGTGQMGQAGTMGSTVALGRVIRHWIGTGKVAGSGSLALALLLLLLLELEGTTTATLTGSVACTAAATVGTQHRHREQPDQQSSTTHQQR